MLVQTQGLFVERVVIRGARLVWRDGGASFSPPAEENNYTWVVRMLIEPQGKAVRLQYVSHTFQPSSIVSIL